jgi:hypothetical protein
VIGKLVKRYRRVRRQITWLERKALLVQGFTLDESKQLMQGFRRDDNLGFAFHFTTLSGARGIVRDRAIRKTPKGAAGPGVYASLCRNPGLVLKTLPFIGFGLFFRPACIPIDLVQVSRLSRNGAGVDLSFPAVPLRTLVVRVEKSALMLA